MDRALTWKWPRALAAAACGWMVAAPLTIGDEPPSLPPEVRQIQQDLGGPAADQFPSLREAPAADAWQDPPTMAPVWVGASSPSASPDGRAAAQVAALRDSAAELDMAANRLETLELYRQSDALRTLAQRLRLGVRADAPEGARCDRNAAGRVAASPVAIGPPDAVDAGRVGRIGAGPVNISTRNSRQNLRGRRRRPADAKRGLIDT